MRKNLMFILPVLALSSWSVQAMALNGTLGLSPHPDQVNPSKSSPVKTASPALKTTMVAQGLNRPWSLAFLPQGGLLVTEREGYLNYIPAGSSQRVRVSGIPQDIEVSGQAGLFEIALAPDYAKTGTVYLSYASPVGGGNVLKVVRGTLKLENAKAAFNNLQMVFMSSPPVEDNKNLGGKLLFMADGTLLVTVGDFFAQKQSQNLGNHLGKVIRINADGTVPTNNPFTKRQGARPEIYSYGNRNVQGIALRPGTSEVWMHEHGPRGGDEVNILRPGANYGWPLASFGVDYSTLTITSRTTLSGTENPLIHWTPSLAPSGLAFYTGSSIPQWQGDAFVGMLAGKQLRRLDIENGKIVGEEPLLENLNARIREVRMGPNGNLYILTDESNGKLLRVEAAKPIPVR